MNRSTRRARLGGLLALALGALALLALPGVAAAKDRNHDRIPDKWEKRHHLSLQVKQTHRDQDSDHLSNLGEFEAGFDPHNPDTNSNGVEDGEENAGEIASFDKATGKLTINLFGGETITGLVDETTEIECGCDHAGEEAATTSSDGQSGEQQGGDDNSPGEETSGPSGQGEDENDDPPGHDGTPAGASEGPGNGSEQSSNCSTEDLAVGAVVKEAELQLENGVATFSKVELGKSEG